MGDCVNRNGAHFIYIYVYHTNVFEADNIDKNTPKMKFHQSFLLFLLRSVAPPITVLTAPRPQLPATASEV